MTQTQEKPKAEDKLKNEFSESEILNFINTIVKNDGPKCKLFKAHTIIKGINYRLNWWNEIENNNLVKDNKIIKSSFIKVIKTEEGLTYIEL